MAVFLTEQFAYSLLTEIRNIIVIDSVFAPRNLAGVKRVGLSALGADVESLPFQVLQLVCRQLATVADQ